MYPVHFKFPSLPLASLAQSHHAKRLQPGAGGVQLGRMATVVCLALFLAACNLEPPISIGQKESLVGQGLVITVTNTSDEHLHEVEVNITSPEGEAKQLTIATLNPHETVNIGWLKLEGWPIPEGSEVSVKSKGFHMAVSRTL